MFYNNLQIKFNFIQFSVNYFATITLCILLNFVLCTFKFDFLAFMQNLNVKVLAKNLHFKMNTFSLLQHFILSPYKNFIFKTVNEIIYQNSKRWRYQALHQFEMVMYLIFTGRCVFFYFVQTNSSITIIFFLKEDLVYQFLNSFTIANDNLFVFIFIMLFIYAFLMECRIYFGPYNNLSWLKYDNLVLKNMITFVEAVKPTPIIKKIIAQKLNNKCKNLIFKKLFMYISLIFNGQIFTSKLVLDNPLPLFVNFSFKTRLSVLHCVILCHFAIKLIMTLTSK